LACAKEDSIKPLDRFRNSQSVDFFQKGPKESQMSECLIFSCKAIH